MNRLCGKSMFSFSYEAAIIYASRYFTKFLVFITLIVVSDIVGGCAPTLVESASYGNISRVRYLLNSGADVNTRGYLSKTALMMAACKGHFEIAKLLIDNGADVNARDDRFFTALMHTDRSEIAKLLIDNGADVNAEDNHSRTASIWALIGRHTETAKYLINKGVDLPSGRAILVLPFSVIPIKLNDIDNPESLRIRKFATIAPGFNQIRVRLAFSLNGASTYRGAPISLNFNAKSGNIYLVNYEYKLGWTSSWNSWIEEFIGQKK